MNLDLTDEQTAFQQRISTFASERVATRAAAIDASGEFPRDLVTAAAGLGLMGVTIPRDWGGAGLDYMAYALAIETLARSSAVVAVIAAVNNSLAAEPIAQFGSDAQKDTWLRRLASGEALGSFALSEEHAGSDAANQQTIARLDENGYAITGRKVWVANAEAADLVVLFAATQPGIRGRGISAFLVPMDAPGLTRSASGDSLGVRGLGCMDLELKEVRVGADALLGAPGDGFRIAMWALDGGRVAIAAQALGVGQAALDEALAYAKSREAFGQPIGNYQAIQWMLADIATDLDAARMLTLRAADSRRRRAGVAAASAVTVDAAMAKLFASEAAHRAADKAMQILASRGYRRGSVVERLFRDVRATEIYQGTSEIQRMVIAEHILSYPGLRPGPRLVACGAPSPRAAPRGRALRAAAMPLDGFGMAAFASGSAPDPTSYKIALLETPGVILASFGDRTREPWREAMDRTRYAARMRYLDASDVDDALVNYKGLAVRSADGEKIGDTDGFIIDATSGRVNYVVIDSGGWFTSQRLLLPIGHANLASDRKSLQLDLTKDALRRLPEYDEDRFREFTDDELRAFERNTVVACCPDEPLEDVSVSTWSYDSRRHYAQPDWWQGAKYAPERLRQLARRKQIDPTAPISAAEVAATPIGGTRDRDHVTARADDDVSPHQEGRAQPGDVLGIETGGEVTGIGDTSDDEDERRREAERRTRRDRG